MKTNTNTHNLVTQALFSKRIQELAGKVGSTLNKKSVFMKGSDLSDLRPEDILSLFHDGKINEKDTMFWLGVLAVSAEEKAKKHEELATTDELTQVYNRRAFVDSFSKELSRLRAKHLQIQKLLEEPITLNLIMIDIDFFKKVNDKYGHLAGDRVLRGVAEVLKKQVRGTDTVFRYGGEEFAILLPDTHKNLAHEAAERINKAVARTSYAIDKKRSIKATVSMGLTSIDGSHLANVNVTDMLIPKLIGQADEALYSAKENGRNQVVIWNKKLKR